MRSKQTVILMSSCLLLSCFCSADAESVVTKETIIQTSTTSSKASTSKQLTGFRLSVTGNYLVVDPITGLAIGTYDPIGGLVDGRLPKAGLIVVDKPTGQVVAMVDAFGKLVDPRVAPVSDMLMVSINAKIKELDKNIANWLEEGLISRSQANALFAQLARIKSEELARVSNDMLTYNQALMAAANLDALAMQVSPVAVVTPVIAPQLVVQNKQLVLLDKVTYRRAQLLQRIEEQYQTGHLSSEFVSRLKEKLDKIAILDTKYRRDGELSEDKERQLAVKLDQLEAEINSDIAIINERRARIGIRVD